MVSRKTVVAPAGRKISLSRRTFLKQTTGVGMGLAAGAGLGGWLAPVTTWADTNPALEYRNYKPDRMSYRRLGKTNFMFSELAFGGASNYGNGQWAVSDATAYRALLERLLDLGINYFDTSHSPQAVGYGTEEDFAWLCTPANRDKVFIATKVDDLSPDGTRTAVEESLRLMQTDYVDLVYVHSMRGISGTDYSEAVRCLDTLETLAREGKVRFKGISGHNNPDAFIGMLTQYPERLDVILCAYYPKEVSYGFMEGSVTQWEDVFRLANEKDVGVVAMKVLLSAIDPWTEREDLLRNDAVAWARLQPFVQSGLTVPQACIRWALANQHVHSAIIGMRTIAEAEENAAAIVPYHAGQADRIEIDQYIKDVRDSRNIIKSYRQGS